jgi:hypothetical protein
VEIGAQVADVLVARFAIAVYAAVPTRDDDALLDEARARDDAAALLWANDDDLARLDVPPDTRDAIARAKLRTSRRPG